MRIVHFEQNENIKIEGDKRRGEWKMCDVKWRSESIIVAAPKLGSALPFVLSPVNCAASSKLIITGSSASNRCR